MNLHFRFVAACALLCAVTAHADDGLPPELLGDTGSSTPVSNNKARAVHDTASGTWLAFTGAVSAGPHCAIVFRQQNHYLGFTGPYAGKPGTISFSGPNIPAASQLRETRIDLIANGKPAQVRAVHLRSNKGEMLLIVPTMVAQTLRSIGDSEELEVKLDGQSVFRVKTEGSFKARDAMLSCLGEK